MRRRSQTLTSTPGTLGHGGRHVDPRGVARPSGRAASITPSRLPAAERLEDTPLPPTSPNAFAVLGDDDDNSEGADLSTLPCPPTLRPTAHGWDSFLDSLGNKEQGDLGTVDEILINYANFAGQEFRAFDRESERMLDRLSALEARMDEDHDEIVGTRHDFSTLTAIVMANANGIASLKSGLAALKDTVHENATTIQELSKIVETMASQLSEVRATAENAYRLASMATPTITGQGVHNYGSRCPFGGALG